MPGQEPTAGQATLEGGDRLVHYTDGITQARDVDGRLFGEKRLVDFLEKEAMAHPPPAETVRRLVRAVLQHQEGILQDDATVLLARWASRTKAGPRPQPPSPRGSAG
jgi:serine phosphatase RsbU (regulator of sigma subunit)